MVQMAHSRGKNCQDDPERATGWKLCYKVSGENNDFRSSVLGLALSLKSSVTLR